MGSVTPYANRIVGHGERRAREILPNERNWRKHDSKQRAALAGILRQVGYVQSVVINRTTGRLVDGHLRVEDAAERDESVPYVEVELTPEEEAMVLATLDPIGAMAGTDDEKLRELLADISTDDGGLAALLESLGKEPKGGQTDPDDVPPVPAEPWVKRGDLFLLGTYVVCPDCGAKTDV